MQSTEASSITVAIIMSLKSSPPSIRKYPQLINKNNMTKLYAYIVIFNVWYTKFQKTKCGTIE
uniref:Uncharacterized protein n=1 Tax=Onchocerca volvulus TaxID=6282 RepID=A0A8R1XQ42_ONCVO